MFYMPLVAPVTDFPEMNTPPALFYQMPDYTPALQRRPNPKGSKNKGDGRLDMVKNAGESTAAQQSFVYYLHTYQKQVERLASNFDTVFRFEFLMLDDHMLPPVISWGHKVFSVNQTGTEAHVAQLEYRVIKAAHIVTHVPTWRDYLEPVVNNPAKTNPFLMPESKDELQSWQKGFIQGWRIGREQASMMMVDQIHALRRDYLGMLRYHVLLDSGVMTNPILSKDKSSTAINDSEMDIGNQTLKITVPAHFVGDEHWKALMESHQDQQPEQMPTL